MLKAPFPWFGGKSRVASLVWSRFGSVANYVEPFAGSLAVLLGRPGAPTTETINDLDCFVANFWRATSRDPEAVADAATWPVNEADLTARHIWLVGRRAELTSRLMADPDFFDAKVAGWWVWGLSSWIGGGWCSGKGPWGEVDGKLAHLGNAGAGVNRKLAHLGGGKGVNRKREDLVAYFCQLRDRLARVRVCCGDWARVTGPSVTYKHGMTGVFLDPPYDSTLHDGETYGVDCNGLSGTVRAWCVNNQDNPLLRIALCGYEGEHELPGWDCVAWKATGGYSSQGEGGDNGNKHKERIWFSPACLNNPSLFG